MARQNPYSPIFIYKRLNDHGEFQQQSPQRLVDKYKHTSSRNDRWRMRLKLIQEEYFFIGNKKVRVVNMMYNKTALHFAPLRFIRQEWSVAPSIFNIKARGSAHC